MLLEYLTALLDDKSLVPDQFQQERTCSVKSRALK